MKKFKEAIANISNILNLLSGNRDDEHLRSIYTAIRTFTNYPADTWINEMVSMENQINQQRTEYEVLYEKYLRELEEAQEQRALANRLQASLDVLANSFTANSYSDIRYVNEPKWITPEIEEQYSWWKSIIRRLTR